MFVSSEENSHLFVELTQPVIASTAARDSEQVCRPWLWEKAFGWDMILRISVSPA
jgi:hypothetical protein